MWTRRAPLFFGCVFGHIVRYTIQWTETGSSSIKTYQNETDSSVSIVVDLSRGKMCVFCKVFDVNFISSVNLHPPRRILCRCFSLIFIFVWDVKKAKSFDMTRLLELGALGIENNENNMWNILKYTHKSTKGKFCWNIFLGSYIASFSVIRFFSIMYRLRNMKFEEARSRNSMEKRRKNMFVRGHSLLLPRAVNICVESSSSHSHSCNSIFRTRGSSKFFFYDDKNARECFDPIHRRKAKMPI